MHKQLKGLCHPEGAKATARIQVNKKVVLRNAKHIIDLDSHASLGMTRPKGSFARNDTRLRI